MKQGAVILIFLYLLTGCSTRGGNKPSAISKPAIPETSRLPKMEPVYGPTNPAAAEKNKGSVSRYASIVELDPAKEKEYRELHADVWQEVVAVIKKANIQNYTVFVTDMDGKRYLVSYLEYTGEDAAEDFSSISEDAVIRDKWWPITDACQKRMPGTLEGEQWKGMEMLMHIE